MPKTNKKEKFLERLKKIGALLDSPEPGEAAAARARLDAIFDEHGVTPEERERLTANLQRSIGREALKVPCRTEHDRMLLFQVALHITGDPELGYTKTERTVTIYAPTEHHADIRGAYEHHRAALAEHVEDATIAYCAANGLVSSHAATVDDTGVDPAPERTKRRAFMMHATAKSRWTSTRRRFKTTP